MVKLVGSFTVQAQVLASAQNSNELNTRVVNVVVVLSLQPFQISRQAPTLEGDSQKELSRFPWLASYFGPSLRLFI